ncbi:hypothetical protein BDY21DRAFT_337042 [Lineolata rhizophorae]|uniref:EF-hand domain-containing protein n=1 Tax=Lineolata rhizophorae TaxID=578093 RepID=A0A6A6P7M5_9PEZI|nr:hypothetical protein BDY21DRAFT_337042 [Lineolata rhizophorae]
MSRPTRRKHPSGCGCACAVSPSLPPKLVHSQSCRALPFPLQLLALHLLPPLHPSPPVPAPSSCLPNPFMAYNKGYNPDALPAHAEPEQAAQLLSSQGQSAAAPPASASRPPRMSSKPGPPHAGSGGYYGDGRQPSPRYDERPGPGGGRYDARYDAGRYGDRPPPPPNPRYHGLGSPPPQSYGAGPPPQGYHGRPPVSNRPPPTPAPPRDGNDRDALWPIFRAVDKDGTHQLTERELGTALVNGDWSPFDPHTVRMMIRMFDTDRSGTINFDEFCGLWGFLHAWRELFDRFDVDRSGSIQFAEFQQALVAFGYRLSSQFVSLLFRTYDRNNQNAISFDLFVQACISLKRMTDVFKKYDEDRDGYITLSFEEFLTEIIRNR